MDYSTAVGTTVLRKIMKQKSIGQAFASVLKFNSIASQLDKPDNNSIALQLDLIQEEYLETVEAFDNNDKVEILDGTLDMFVVVCGLMQKLEAQGYNVEEALKRVCENNVSKFPSYEGNKTNIWPPEYQVLFNEKHKVIVLKNKAGKTVKPPGFKPVDISDCVPGGVA
jgi:hypothetical protein